MTVLVRTFDTWIDGHADDAREELEADFRAPGFDPSRDTWYVVAPDGSLAAFALYSDRQAGFEGAAAFGKVHPERRGMGLGAFLVDEMDRRWSTTDATPPPARLRHWVSGNDREADRLLSSRGYELVRRSFHLERPLADVPLPEPPPGVSLRPVVAGEEPALHRLDDEAFAEHWGYAPMSFEEFRIAFERSLSGPGLAWVAEEDGRLVGHVLLALADDGGWVHVLGVRKEVRGRGIGRALLRAGFAELARRGRDRALIGVDTENASGALQLYLGEGMTVRRSWHAMEKRLGSATLRP